MKPKKSNAMSPVEISVTDSGWHSFIESQCHSTIFHHPAWSELLADCYGYHPFVIAATGVHGEVLAGMPMMEVSSWLTGRRWVSLPFTDYCPPLHKDRQALATLLDYLVRRQAEENVPKIEIRWALPRKDGVYPDFSYALHTLRLSKDSETVFETFKKTQVQQCILKAERDGVTVKKCKSKRDFDIYYKLHLQTRQRLGLPVQPKKFFDALWDRLLEKGLGFALLAYKGSVPLAGAVFLSYNGILTYKYSASDSAYWNLRPNNLVLWEAIRWACEHGYRLFDWGKTDLSHDGLRVFKNGWGTKEILLTYSVISSQPSSAKSEGAKRLLGQVIKRSPAFVCRTTGELLYKHFG